jgi:polar amino acid transport system substrate-binding protein
VNKLFLAYAANMEVFKKWAQVERLTLKSVRFSRTGIHIGVLLLMTFPINANAGEALKISAVADTPFVAKGVGILTEVYKNAGIEATFEFLPAKRSIKLVNEGRMDGEAMRTANAAANFPNLIRVEVPLVVGELIAWSAVDIGPINSISDFANLRVGLLSGDVAAIKLAEGAKTYSASKFSQLAEMLVRNRIDIALAWKRNFLPLVSSSAKFTKIHAAGKTLYTTKGYHFLHRKHKDLIPRLEKSLRELWADGSMDKMWSAKH